MRGRDTKAALQGSALRFRRTVGTRGNRLRVLAVTACATNA